MTFIHEDPEWSDLLRIVAEHLGRNVAVVEKDYWVTHALWALLEQGFEIWFKGGTSLSKGFDLIERFSEDLDLRIDPGTVSGLPEVRSWKGQKQNQVERRRRFFEALTNAITVPGAGVQLGPEGQDRYWRGAQLQVVYPIEFASSLPTGMRPFVLLELGMAKVTPSVDRDLTSWVRDWLEREGHLSSFADNRPRGVRCLHPLVTLFEKLDLIAYKFARDPFEPDAFVRHYEDAARIALRESQLPDIGVDAHGLLEQMVADGDVRRRPDAGDPAFQLEMDNSKREALDQAYEAISALFWGERIPLPECCQQLRGWLRGLREAAPA